MNCNKNKEKSAVVIYTVFVIAIDEDECLKKLEYCGKNATCHNTIGSYFCLCEKGFTPTHNFTLNDSITCQGKESLI